MFPLRVGRPRITAVLLGASVTLLTGCQLRQPSSVPSMSPARGPEAYSVLLADGFKEEGTMLRITAEGGVLSSERVSVQGATLQAWRPSTVSFTNDRASQVWTLDRDHRITSVSLPGPVSAVVATPRDQEIRVANLGQQDDSYQSEVQLRDSSGTQTATQRIPISVNWIGTVGDSVVAVGDDGHYMGHVITMDGATLHIRRAASFTGQLGARFCRPTSDSTITCADATIEQAGSSNRWAVLSQYNTTSGQRTPLASAPAPAAPVEATIVGALPAPHQDLVLTADGLTRRSGSTLETVLPLTHDGLAATKIIGTHGAVLDVLLTRPEGTPCDHGRCQLGEVKRVDLTTLRIVRTTPITGPENGGGLSMVVPAEFFAGRTITQ